MSWRHQNSKESGPVCPFERPDKQCFNYVGPAAKVEWKRNGLRHSFISYRLANIKNVHQVSLEAGNSPQMVFAHYRQLVTERRRRNGSGSCRLKVGRTWCRCPLCRPQMSNRNRRARSPSTNEVREQSPTITGRPRQVQELGANQAKEVGDTHEKCHPGTPAEDQMDQLNNEIGRGLANGETACGDACAQAARDGGLNTLNPN